jgi:hypothetical protein
MYIKGKYCETNTHYKQHFLIINIFTKYIFLSLIVLKHF